MLMKLFKYDMKFSYRIMTFIYIIALALSVFFSGTLLLSQKLEYVSIFSVISFLPYMFSLLAVTLSGFLVVAVRTYKNLYTDEGYLTFTLPVTSAQIIWSKVLLYVFWQIAGILVLLLSTALPFVTVAYVQGVGGEIAGVLELAVDFVGFWARNMLGLDASKLAVLISVMVVNSLVVLVATPVSIVFSFTVGQLANRYRILLTFVAYYIYTLVMNTLLSVVESLFIAGDALLVPEANFNFDMTAFLYASTASVLIDIVITVAIFVISRNIMSKKLNLI